VGFHAGEDHGTRRRARAGARRSRGAAGGERGLLERGRVVQEHAQLGSVWPSPFGYCSVTTRGAEAPAAVREQDLQITDHLVAPLGIHCAERRSCTSVTDEDGLVAWPNPRSGDCRVLCHDAPPLRDSP